MKKKIVNITKNVLFLLFYVWVTLCGVIGFVAELVLKPFAKMFNNWIKGRENEKEIIKTIEKIVFMVLNVFLFCWGLILVLLHPIGMAIVIIIGLLLEKDLPFFITWATGVILFTVI